MSDLLPVLQSQSAPMSLCSICPKPGRCCSGFNLTGGVFEAGTLWEKDWRARAQELCDIANVPFRPISIEIESDGEEGKYGTVRYGCPELRDDGLCGIYETRPDACRRFVPGTSPLCVMPVEKYKSETAILKVSA